jgi:hypothetical protein
MYTKVRQVRRTRSQPKVSSKGNKLLSMTSILALPQRKPKLGLRKRV